MSKYIIDFMDLADYQYIIGLVIDDNKVKNVTARKVSPNGRVIHYHPNIEQIEVLEIPGASLEKAVKE